ncbi:hypothetical protein KCU77_g11545, partial [Aureobasidium melanogenum]
MASLTDTQTRYLALAWLCFDAEPKPLIIARNAIDTVIDYEKFAELAGLKSAHSGREMLRVTKKKLMDFAPPAASNGTVAPPNTPAVKTPKRKASSNTKSTKGKANKKRKVASDSDGSEDDEETPLKRKTVIKNEPVDEDSEAGTVAGADAEDAEV